MCFDVGFEVVQGKGAKLCQCRIVRQRKRLLDAIPARFADVRLDAIKPDTRRHARQAAAIESVRANRDGCLFLAGQPNTGKSMLMWALYRDRIEAGGVRVVCATLSEIIEEYRQVFQSLKLDERPHLPRLTVEALTEPGVKYAVFLDDIDKANVTDYVAEQVYRIVNAVYERGHQLVVTTNKSPSALAEQYSRRDESRGEPIIRRMLDGATLIQMF